MGSVLEEFRRWFPSHGGGRGQEGHALVLRSDSEDGTSLSEDEEGEEVSSVSRFDMINTGFEAESLMSGGSSGEIGAGEMVLPGVDILIGDADGKIESDDSEIRHMNPNDVSSGSHFGMHGRGEEGMQEHQNPDISIHDTTSDTDSGTRRKYQPREDNLDVPNLMPSELQRGGQMESQISQESRVTKSTVLSQPQQVNNTRKPLCHGGTLGGVVAGSAIDTQASGKPPMEDKHGEQVSESSIFQHLLNPEGTKRSRSASLSRYPNNELTPDLPASAIRGERAKSLPAKLKRDEHSERKISIWKRKRVSPASSQVSKRSSRDTTTSSISSVDSPDTSRWKGMMSRFSVRKVGNTILTAVTQLFSQFLPQSYRDASCRKTSIVRRRQGDPQETARDTVRRRQEVLTQQDVENRDKADNTSKHSGSGSRVACRAVEKHNTEEKVLSDKEDGSGDSFGTRNGNKKTQVNEAYEAHDDDNVTRKEVVQGSMRVKDIVRQIEGGVRDDEDTESQKDPKSRKLRDEAVQKMRLPLVRVWEDRRQSSENEPITLKEIVNGDPEDANALIPQADRSKTKENEDQTIEKTDEAAESRIFAARETAGMETKRSSDAEEEDKSETDTEEESEDEPGEIVMRHPKNHTAATRFSMVGLRRLSGQTTSIYRYSMVRPRTVIIGLGVCTETKFINDSFGDGVSETESEDEEDISPAPVPAPAPTPTRQRPTTPSRTSRPHSPLSDMDTESKRNSQAVSTEPSDFEDHSSVTTSDLDYHEPPVVDSRKDKAYRIALELLHTERTYVKVLHLIDQEFQFRVDNENRAHHMFPHDVILHMFSNIKSIYKLHHDFLLPQLEERMAQWEHNRRIGDIMKNFAPFLKMYTEYVRNFDNAMTLINQWQAKCPRFATIMDDIHSMEVCGSLTLQHHMLSPVQRIPRYEMLLRDYLKKLPEDSPDCHDTEKALHLVSTAANHANDAMKKIDKFEKLLEIQESLGGAEDLVSPTRELIKEGKIIKISARSGDHQERYIFLLTDLLLLCSPRLMGGRVMSGPQYRLRAKYHVENLIIQEGDNLETANTFYIKDNNKSVELYTQTIEEKEQWLDAFIRAIHETSQRKSSLKLHFNPNQRILDMDLGQKQPMLIRSDSVTKCMECGSQFTMVRRKHHCRACGAVVCSKCSSFKASLAYECGKSVRVCRTCHAALQELSSSTATPSPEIDDGDECSVYSAKDHLDLPFRNRGVLEVSAKTSGAVIQSFLQLKTHRKTWVKRWFALHTDFVLYSFKCEADDQALTATPVPGFTVTHLQGTRNESGISDKEKERAFKLHHAKKQYIFQAASKDESQRWVAALKKASQAELPSPVQ